MLKENIGNISGKIWDLLQEKDELAITRIPRLLKEKSAMVYQGLGWLAREDKVTYRKKGERIYVSLADSERKR